MGQLARMMREDSTGPPDSTSGITGFLKAALDIVVDEVTHQLGKGSTELMAAVYTGQGFVLYPREQREQSSVYGPEQPTAAPPEAERPVEQEQRSDLSY